MDLQSPIVRFKEPLNAYILHFSRFPLGIADAVSRIPSNQAGIYFWFRAFNYPNQREGFSNALKKDLDSPKFPTRTGQVKPYFEVSIGSSSGISKGKSNQLDKALKQDTFRDHLRNLLNLSVIFQAPLYIGKSKDIRQRVESHLSEASILQDRLSQCNLDIEQTALLVMPMEEHIELGLDDFDDELLYEEIFSRLFNPLLNLRIG
tara:strand:- start:21430 stop:22044 length:615 start_codon:yes stop_codon:yes gene_type:complete